MRAPAIGLLFLSLSYLVPAVLVKKPASSSSDSYSLYAYGDAIGGLPLYYADGNAVVANKALANATEVAQVAFTSDPSGLLLGNPANETSSLGSHNNSSKIFTDQQLYIPRADSTGHQVGFTRDASSSEVTTKFVWYGHFLLVETESGEYTSLFYAKKTKQDGAYSLQWNITDDDETEFVSVSMRSIAPSNA